MLARLRRLVFGGIRQDSGPVGIGDFLDGDFVSESRRGAAEGRDGVRVWCWVGLCVVRLVCVGWCGVLWNIGVIRARRLPYVEELVERALCVSSVCLFLYEESGQAADEASQ